MHSKELRPARDRFVGSHQTNANPPDDVLGLVETIVNRSSRERPTDALLRAELKATKGLSPDAATEISRCTFAYFRWFGWLNQSQAIRQRIREALRLDNRFHRDPLSFKAHELIAKVLPGWISQELEISEALVRAFQSPPRIWLRAKRNQGTNVAKSLRQCRQFAPLVPDALEYVGENDLFLTKEFHSGEFELQDISSQAVSLVCNPKKGETWWDACAGEGGKLLHLSELMENGGLIWASDRAEWRLKMLKRRAARAKAFNYRAVPWNGTIKLPTKTKFDGVLVDAPCSGVGTWGRNPHARWTLTPDDVRELAALQLQLLQHASAAVKPGGKLIYSVCTLLKSETVHVLNAFQERNPSFKSIPIKNPLLAESEPKSELWLMPQDFGGNGMYIAVWKRLE